MLFYTDLFMYIHVYNELNVEQHHDQCLNGHPTKLMESGIHFLNIQRRIQKGSKQLSKNFGIEYNEPAIRKNFERFD